MGKYIGGMLLALLRAGFDRLPSQCGVCRAWPSRSLCAECIAQFAQPRARCATCAQALETGALRCGACHRTPTPLDRALAAVDYGYPWVSLVSAFKFHGHTAWAHSMATLMRSTPWVEPALEAADVLLPMPLAPERLRERGFNQALLLARALDPAKTRADWALRLRHTPAQSSLTRPQRLDNLNGAFALEPRHYAAVRGRRLVLVDDVMTTGASVYALARVLRAAGAAHITALVFARTE